MDDQQEGLFDSKETSDSKGEKVKLEERWSATMCSNDGKLYNSLHWYWKISYLALNERVSIILLFKK